MSYLPSENYVGLLVVVTTLVSNLMLDGRDQRGRLGGRGRIHTSPRLDPYGTPDTDEDCPREPAPR